MSAEGVTRMFETGATPTDIAKKYPEYFILDSCSYYAAITLFHFLEYFGQIVAIAIPWSILILFLIWMWVSGKNPFTSDEEE